MISSAPTRRRLRPQIADAVHRLTASTDASAGRAAVENAQAYNIVVTNVPGPQFPLYLAGRRMTAGYPFVPIAGHLRTMFGQIAAVGADGQPNERTFSQMTDDEKNAISHRGRAFRMMVEACFG